MGEKPNSQIPESDLMRRITQKLPDFSGMEIAY
jgi:hypothetical protein